MGSTIPADAEALSKPLPFPASGRVAPNRFLKGAMSERLASWSATPEKRGIPSPELIHLYSTWADGQVGVLITGNVMVDPEHVEALGNTAVPLGSPTQGERFEAFQKLAAGGKKSGSLMLAQISHPGRQCDERIQSDPVSASDVQLQGKVMGITFAKPHPASAEELKSIVEKFAYTAEYLERAGFDGIEVHAAHGYLVAQFLSLTTNHRTDQYGGSIENRARLLTEIIQAIRQRTSNTFIVGVKLNSVEFQESGLQPAEACELCRLLESLGVDFIELSGGTYESVGFIHKKDSTRKREAYFIEFAEQIVPAIRSTRVYITGGFRSVSAMASALNTVDGIGIGRPLCHEPYLCRDILSGKAAGAADIKLDQNNVQLTNAAALMQMWRQGKGQVCWDLTDEKNLLNLMQALGIYRKTFEADDFMDGEHDFREAIMGKL